MNKEVERITIGRNHRSSFMTERVDVLIHLHQFIPGRKLLSKNRDGNE